MKIYLFQKQNYGLRKQKQLYEHNRMGINSNVYDVPGADPGGGGRTRRAPPPKIGKKYDFFASNRDFSHEIPQQFSHLPPLGAIFLNAPPLAQNPVSAPVFNIMIMSKSVNTG